MKTTLTFAALIGIGIALSCSNLLDDETMNNSLSTNAKADIICSDSALAISSVERLTNNESLSSMSTTKTIYTAESEYTPGYVKVKAIISYDYNANTSRVTKITDILTFIEYPAGQYMTWSCYEIQNGISGITIKGNIAAAEGFFSREHPSNILVNAYVSISSLR